MTDEGNVQGTVITSYAEAPALTIAANGTTYAYRELGPKGGIPVVYFVHLGATLDNWDPRIVDPVAAHRHVITFDNKGVGASTGKVPGTVEQMADDAYDFIRALGHQKIDVVSFSLGGFVAQELIEKHPDLVRKLVLTGTGPKGGKGIDKVTGITVAKSLRATLAREDPKQFLFFNRDSVGKTAGKAFIERLKERTVDRDKDIALPAFTAQLKAIKKYGTSAPGAIEAFTQPTLIANGDNDIMVPSPLSYELRDRIPGSELIIYPNSGHGGIFQYHAQFAPALVEFLGK